MPQTRFFAAAAKDAAHSLYGAIEAAFEEDGLPLAIVETDEARGLWEVSLYAADPAEAEPRLRAILAAVAPGLRLEREDVPDIDWVAKSLEGLQPVRAGRFLVHGSHDRDRRRIGDLAIEIEAGLAFGTGHHATTAGCLEMLGSVVRAGHPRNALDLGTGSAVLAIALAKLARIPVLATDIDPVAVRVAASNVRLNGVSSLVETAVATGLGSRLFAARGPFDLVVANILARPLMQLAPAMAHVLAPGGSLILSGILESQRHAVIAAYAGQRFRHIRTLRRDGWVTLLLKRHSRRR